MSDSLAAKRLPDTWGEKHQHIDIEAADKARETELADLRAEDLDEEPARQNHQRVPDEKDEEGKAVGHRGSPSALLGLVAMELLNIMCKSDVKHFVYISAFLRDCCDVPHVVRARRPGVRA